MPRDELPTEFAIFPLPGALLLPRGKLPLNIFEPRYLAMIEDTLGAGRVIGMVQPDETRPETPNGPALYRIGCLGRLSSFSETEDGRFLITLSGLLRFRTEVEIEARRGYRRVRADLAPFEADLAGPKPFELNRARLVGDLRLYFQAHQFDANWSAIDEMEDEALVSTLAMVCPFEPAEKQALLEAADTATRAKTLMTLLQMGAHGAANGHQVS